MMAAINGGILGPEYYLFSIIIIHQHCQLFCDHNLISSASDIKAQNWIIKEGDNSSKYYFTRPNLTSEQGLTYLKKKTHHKTITCDIFNSWYEAASGWLYWSWCNGLCWWQLDGDEEGPIFLHYYYLTHRQTEWWYNDGEDDDEDGWWSQMYQHTHT